MSMRSWRKTLMLGTLAALSAESLAFQQAESSPCRRDGLGRPRRRVPTFATAVAVAEATDEATKPCYYRRADGPWRPRKELRSLSVGERLFAKRLPDRDLLDGKSGPKVFLECGVGKRNIKGDWNIVNGMVRIGRKGMKKSVVRKKVNKIPHKELVEVYVSKISLDEGRFEVCLNREEALENGSRQGRTSASSLKVGEEYVGIVKQVKPYGVFVNVNNANRNGLIHISKVAQRYDAYVNKEEGLKNWGLKVGAPVNVVVLKNKRKRLELDFAPDAEESVADDENALASADSTVTINITPRNEASAWAAYESNEESNDNGISEDEAFMWAAYAAGDDASSDEGGGSSVSDDEAAMWAAYAADYDNEEEDEYDEDADIEDALGIASY